MAKYLFTLSMPNRGSWNGRWSGEEKIYAKTRTIPDSHKIETKSYFYSWGDGWGASVNVQKVTQAEAAKMLRKSSGFCGYEWMIDSIIKCGKIEAPTDSEGS